MRSELPCRMAKVETFCADKVTGGGSRMNHKSNILPLKQNKRKLKTTARMHGQGPAPVLDMVERRQEMIRTERRRTRRNVLSEFVSAWVVVPEKGLLEVGLYDISIDGLSFDCTWKKGQFRAGEQIAMRVYLNQKTYFSFIVEVQHVLNVKDENVFRHGVKFIKEPKNEPALYHFVKFIEAISMSLQEDHGDLVASSIK